jgi:EAL domain-containing protein (putative c-di-GMP-specific phosphodiesterase class I)
MPRFEYLVDPRRGSQRFAIDPLPFVIGRDRNANFMVPSQSVSKRHAEVFEREGRFWIRDLGSRNGTSVNGLRVNEIVLSEGDIIHLAHSEFRYLADQAAEAGGEPQPPGTDQVKGKTPPSVLQGRPILQEMIQSRAIRVIFQPIVDLLSGDVIAFEALGRGCSPQLSTRPADLFRLANMCAMGGDLSRAFRRVAVKQAITLPDGAALFCNLHPDEFLKLKPEEMDQLLPSLPVGRRLVLEVHEETIADVPLLRRLRDDLRARGVGLAYDDFGAGQSRLAELAEVPPDYVKLDMRLIQGIDGKDGRRDVVHAICELAGRLGVTVIAEGIEKPGELHACVRAGCRVGQGFLLGHPEYNGPVANRMPTVTRNDVIEQLDQYRKARRLKVARLLG